MHRSTTRILTTHTGSLPRPDDLLALIAEHERGALADPAAFEARLQTAVVEVVRKQVAAGVDLVNDGEAGRADFASYTRHRLSGFGAEESFANRGLHFTDIQDFPDDAAQLGAPIEAMRSPLCDGPISYADPGPLQRDVANLQRALDGVQVEGAFISAVSPGELALYCGNRYYASQDAYLDAIAGAMRTEYEAIHRAGFLLQLDCPDLGLGYHFYFAGSTVEEYRKRIARHVEALNQAVANIPAEAMRLHVCYGPIPSPHHRDIPLGDILDVLLEAKPAGLNFEAANPRHEHEWRLFEHTKLPDGKYLIPGVLDVTSNRIEHPELVAERLTRLARLVGRENVVAGTDCGFRTAAAAGFVAPGVVWAKLAALSEGARLASNELWAKGAAVA
jgi:5-methyltetrahydropteroyltriglutamate--homocysteine methyltransferase